MAALLLGRKDAASIRELASFTPSVAEVVDSGNKGLIVGRVVHEYLVWLRAESLRACGSENDWEWSSSLKC